MILSISMIVKNEEKYLDRTLKALVPLMQEVESELIIVDTGSTDNTVDIAKKYTKNVFFKEWTGNFAEMRNESIKHAKGEWILILDADEELVDYSNFIDFINSDKASKYKTGVVQLKNFVNESLTKSTDAPMPRLFKNEKNFKYTGRIHEQPLFQNPVYNPVNGIMLFNHYGYIYEDESIRQRKMKRNEELLFKELEENPNDPYMNYQLGQNYMVLNKIKDAVFYLEKSVELYTKKNRVYIPACVKLSSCYLFLNDNVKCEKECIRYLKTDKKNIDIYYYLAMAQFRMSKYSESVKNFEKYFYYINNYSESTQAVNIACNCETLKYKMRAILIYCDALIKTNQYSKAFSIVDNLDGENEDISEVYPMLIELLDKSNKFEEVLNYYNRLVKSKTSERVFFSSVESYLPKNRVDNRESIYRILSSIDGNYGVLNSIRIGKDVDEKVLLDILKVENDSYYGELLIFAYNNDLDVCKICSEVDMYKLDMYFRYILSINKNFIDYMYSKIYNSSIALDLDTLKYKVSIMKALIESGGLSSDRVGKLYELYVIEKYRFIRSLYNVSISDEDILKLVSSIDDYLVVKMKTLLEVKKINPLCFAREIKQLIVKYPSYKSIFEYIVLNFVKETDTSIEVSKLKNEFKALIRNSLQSNNFDVFDSLVSQYKDMNGEDEEIISFEVMRNILSGNLEKALEFSEKLYRINGLDYDNMYNLAFIIESRGDNQRALDIYRAIGRECKDTGLLEDLNSRIDFIIENNNGI